ncbi:hypothetical protein PCH_Pc12g06030 [Penicillium rubens Wisconsin 54-1255]|uniref:Uncharacterized protein n=1 Tax=Penicillium rubens (strain ATCC 28089 / DSM 1075 / NRRL 1951 / Wisconsin 54-1255) TaxID=500485 RepID=B6GZX6_PENRW|nr:hypothetical protein PCH_Pc12g06030 [Penicillium rubens Wisconsin 54-1255]
MARYAYPAQIRNAPARYRKGTAPFFAPPAHEALESNPRSSRTQFSLGKVAYNGDNANADRYLRASVQPQADGRSAKYSPLHDSVAFLPLEIKFCVSSHRVILNNVGSGALSDKLPPEPQKGLEWVCGEGYVEEEIRKRLMIFGVLGVGMAWRAGGDRTGMHGHNSTAGPLLCKYAVHPSTLK